MQILSLLQSNDFLVIDVRFLSYYVDFGGKLISETFLQQLLPCLCDHLCNDSMNEEMEYSFLLLCSHTFHTARFLSTMSAYSKSLSQLEFRFLSWLPSLLHLPLSVCFFICFSSERFSRSSPSLLPAPTPFRLELSLSIRSLRGFVHSSFLHHIALLDFFHFFHAALPLFIQRSPIPPRYTHASLSNLSQRHRSFDSMDPFLVRRASGSKRSFDGDSFLLKTGRFPNESSPFTHPMGSRSSAIPFCFH